MAYDEVLADRVRAHLDGESGLTQRKMFGGIAWMLDGNMAVGLMKDGLMVRLGEQAEAAASEPHASAPMMGERPMKGMVVVAPEGVETDEQLGAWIGRGAAVARSLPPK
ncbi:MAG TPA: TfoX/Sxy family protein [Solirubrobacteraceae bacterium]|nr:TfoX/Sxy family protein [Solirubrobacteraceae bacterium]